MSCLDMITCPLKSCDEIDEAGLYDKVDPDNQDAR